MNAARDLDPLPLDEIQQDDSLEPIVPQPSLDDLSPESSGRIVRYIVTSSLEHGVAPTAVVAARNSCVERFGWSNRRKASP